MNSSRMGSGHPRHYDTDNAHSSLHQTLCKRYNTTDKTVAPNTIRPSFGTISIEPEFVWELGTFVDASDCVCQFKKCQLTIIFSPNREAIHDLPSLNSNHNHVRIPGCRQGQLRRQVLNLLGMLGLWKKFDIVNIQPH